MAETLDGSGTAPPLAGSDFKGNWNGQTVDDLFEKMQTSMPADQPGRLSREQNADILAFLLMSNSFRLGRKNFPAMPMRCKRFDSSRPSIRGCFPFKTANARASYSISDRPRSEALERSKLAGRPFSISWANKRRR